MWLRIGEPDGFRDSGLELTTQDTMHRLYQRDFPPGLIVLGGNRDDGKSGGISQYVAIVTPARSPAT